LLAAWLCCKQLCIISTDWGGFIMHAKNTNTAMHFTHGNYRYRLPGMQLIRPMTLTGTISPVISGTILAAQYGPIHFDLFAVMLIASVLLQGATIIFNDYYDFSYGQDRDKWIPEHEGASRHGPLHHKTPYIALAMLGAAAILGLWLAIHSSLWIIL